MFRRIVLLGLNFDGLRDIEKKKVSRMIFGRHYLWNSNLEFIYVTKKSLRVCPCFRIGLVLL